MAPGRAAARLAEAVDAPGARAALVGAIVTLPFVLWNPPHSGTASSPCSSISRSGRTLSASCRGGPRRAMSRRRRWSRSRSAAAASALALWRLPRTPAGFAMAIGVTFFGFFVFNKQAFCNYYFFVVGVALRRGRGVASAGERRVSRSGRPAFDDPTSPAFRERMPWIALAALVLAGLIPLIWPGDVPFINDEPQLIAECGRGQPSRPAGAARPARHVWVPLRSAADLGVSGAAGDHARPRRRSQRCTSLLMSAVTGGGAVVAVAIAAALDLVRSAAAALALLLVLRPRPLGQPVPPPTRHAGARRLRGVSSLRLAGGLACRSRRDAGHTARPSDGPRAGRPARRAHDHRPAARAVDASLQPCGDRRRVPSGSHGRTGPTLAGRGRRRRGAARRSMAGSFRSPAARLLSARGLDYFYGPRTGERAVCSKSPRAISWIGYGLVWCGIVRRRHADRSRLATARLERAGAPRGHCRRVARVPGRHPRHHRKIRASALPQRHVDLAACCSPGSPLTGWPTGRRVGAVAARQRRPPCSRRSFLTRRRARWPWACIAASGTRDVYGPTLANQQQVARALARYAPDSDVQVHVNMWQRFPHTLADAARR